MRLVPALVLLTALEAHGQTLERYPQREPPRQAKKQDLRKQCADARVRIGRLHGERRASRDPERHIPEIERLGRFVDTRCPPE